MADWMHNLVISLLILTIFDNKIYTLFSGSCYHTEKLLNPFKCLQKQSWSHYYYYYYYYYLVGHSNKMQQSYNQAGAYIMTTLENKKYNWRQHK